MTIFDGDPLQYTKFIRSFAYGVEDKTSNSRDRLEYLCQYTSGEAKVLVESCLHFPNPDDGYRKAKELLRRNFGNPNKISEAYLAQIPQLPQMKSDDTTALHNLSLFLNDCQNTLNNIGHGGELDSSSTIRSIVLKLPYGLRDKWRHMADTIVEERGQIVKFNDLVNFVDKCARIATNPVFGSIQTPKDEDPKKRWNSKSPKEERFKKTNRANVYHSTVLEDSKSEYKSTSKKAVSNENTPSCAACLYCKGKTHVILECWKFDKLQAKEKSEFCRNNSLCYGCLNPGHTRRRCRKPEKCTKCTGKHPTVLHNPDWEKKVSESKNKITCTPKVPSGCVGIQEKLCATTSTNNTQTPLMTIVPVLVKHKSSDQSIATYAFLDHGCGAVFADQNIAEEMHVRTRTTKLCLKL